MSSSIDVTVGEVAAALVLVAVAVAISRWRGAGLEADIGIAVVRSFVQLTAVGFVIAAIFDEDTLLLVVVLLSVMVGFGAFTARARARHVPDALRPLLVALTLSAVATLGLVLALGIFPATPRYLVPVGGMVTVVLFGAILGVVASLRPASKAAKLNVLEAIATE